MKIPCSLSVISWMLICAAIVAAQTNPVAQKTGTATVSGRITLGEKPAANVVVGLVKTETMTAQDLTPVARATTDADGRYRMTNVVAGRFRLQAMAPGYITEEQKAEMFNSGRTLNLNEGDTVENMDFKLTKGGVMTGKVTDADGRPLIAARLQLYLVQADGRKQPNPFLGNNFMMLQTDDRGEYRVYGLMEGRYVIGVSSAGSGANQPAAYHPNTTSQDEATIVSVTAGSESRDIDIRLAREGRKVFGVTARVIDVDTGQPVAGVMLSYRTFKPGQQNFSSSVSGMSDGRGVVRLDGLSPGTYRAEISSFARMQGVNTDYYSEPTPFEITDSDIDAVEIRAHRGLAVSGTVVIEGVNDPALTANLLSQIGADGLMAMSRSQNPQQGSPIYPHNFKPNRDGTFRVSGLAPGVLFINLNQRTARGFMLVRTEAPNQNERGEVILTAGQPLNGVRLVLAYGTATVRGQAQVINGALPPNARLNVNARRADAPRTGGGGRFAEVDARGSFLLDNLPAGEYEITLTSFSPTTMVTVATDGTTTTSGNPAPPPRPMMVRQKVIVPATGEIAVTMTLDVAAQQNPQRERE